MIVSDCFRVLPKTKMPEINGIIRSLCVCGTIKRTFTWENWSKKDKTHKKQLRYWANISLRIRIKWKSHSIIKINKSHKLQKRTSRKKEREKNNRIDRNEDCFLQKFH